MFCILDVFDIQSYIFTIEFLFIAYKFQSLFIDWSLFNIHVLLFFKCQLAIMHNVIVYHINV